MTRNGLVVLALLIACAFLAGVAVSAQVLNSRPVTPKVIESPDVGFRVEAMTGTTPTGHLVVRVNGEWVEVQLGGGVHTLK
ncbi:MAG TPA: hypothetical protein VL173_01655 [Vicinamibacterales bacterium]|nr:hypothetical protein [Vicinamibacterales bacterium]